MKMTFWELDRIPSRSLFNKMYGHRELERNQWERVRMQTYLLLSPHFGKGARITPHELMPMPWDGEVFQSAKTDAAELKKERDKLWAAIDSQKKATKIKKK